MDELFSQLSVVSAILGGFAFTFVGALLAFPATSRVYVWVFGASPLAAMAFMVTALGSVLASLAVKNSYPVDVASLHGRISQAFLLGILCFFVATGACGWLKNRKLGYVSLSIALGSALGVALLLVPFLARG